ncbi:Rne/Rng family ribonuclease [Metabacillus idriensis]|uniref:Rne/Rng family ribonuclease n=1 Tax=Metabacillus idriensis TaxID=324768 RepID=UPI00174B4F55|nr:Rne/Rng family ribonuclease [Metabacillus idriensis]
MRTLVLNAKGGQNRCVLLEDEVVQEIHVHHINETAGSIYAGRVLNFLQGMQAAFIDIGQEKNGYLSMNDLPAILKAGSLHEGQQLFVQVAKEAIEHKGPKLTANLEFGGQFLVYMPTSGYIAVSKKIENPDERERLQTLGTHFCGDNEGLVFRTAANGQAEAKLYKEYQYLKKKYEDLLENTQIKAPALLTEGTPFFDRILREIDPATIQKIICDDLELTQDLKSRYENTEVHFHQSKLSIFDAYKIEHEIDKALKRIVWLKNGAYLVIDQTEALTAIDVNTGKFSGKSSLRETVLKTNIEAAREAARQIRLRDLSGMIIIDFIDMKHHEDKQAVLKEMLQEAKRDRVQSRMIGFTQMNIFQMTRKRVRPDLASRIMCPCPVCSGTGQVLSPDTVAFKLERELWELQFMEHEAALIELPYEAAEAFRGKNDVHIKRLEQVLHFEIFLKVNTEWIDRYKIVQLGDREIIRALMKNKDKI